MSVGIDDLNLAAGRRSIDLRLLVGHGRQTVANLTNVGFCRRSVLNVCEDPVTLAAEAAKPLVEDPAEIGLLLVGTESGLDYGKPISSYLHGVLGLSSRCRNAEIKHACYGATMALRLACSWVREHPGRKALVVGTDICRRHSGPTELTAGLGAVAMTVTENPRVLEVGAVSGSAAQDTWDVARPTREFEFGDAVLSLCSYLDLLEMAWEDLSQATAATLDEFDYLLYHCPLISMVRQAHASLTGGLDDFEERVEPGLRFNREVANIYGGSLYASLLGLIESRNVDPGTRVGLFSYGSGACAEFSTGVIGRDARRVRRHGVTQRLADRQPCTVPEWLAADEALEAQLGAPDLDVPIPAGFSGLALERITGWRREYQWID
jgi:3-hydroxy-3-methylglutaryl CoA synthase